MKDYLIRRTISTVVLLWLVGTLVFVILHLLPGDPVLIILGGEYATPNPEQIEAVYRQLGLDRPLWQQYMEWWIRLLSGNLGTSLITHNRIVEDLTKAFPRTVLLAVPAMTVAIVVGIPVGVLAAFRHGTWCDVLLSILSLFGFSIPMFVTGPVLILIFGIWLRWLPASGYIPANASVLQALRRLILPIASLSLVPTASIVRTARASVLECLPLDYVRTAYAKGLRARTVLYMHVLKNALIPVVTVVGLYTGMLFTGAVILEHVFTWPGMGRYLVKAAAWRDYPAIQATILLVAVIFIMVNFVTDLCYGLVDPRIRYR